MLYSKFSCLLILRFEPLAMVYLYQFQCLPSETEPRFNNEIERDWLHRMQYCLFVCLFVCGKMSICNNEYLNHFITKYEELNVQHSPTCVLPPRSLT